MLDWYMADKDQFLETLPILDGDMNQVGFFSDIFAELTHIIGADLIYFEESIEPLVNTVKHAFKVCPNLEVFYCCMKVRGKEIADKFIYALNQHFSVEFIDKDVIDAFSAEEDQHA